MTRITHTLLFLFLACAFATGCSKDNQEQATGKATLLGVNAIVGAPNVSFKIEERSLGTIEFGTSTQPVEYDDLPYTFNFDVTLPGASSARRLASLSVDAVADQLYQFVLSGTFDNPEIILWQDDEREWDGTETVFELSFAHVNNELQAIDVYFAEPGTAPMVGNEIGTLNPGDRIAPAEFAAGDYVLTLTAAGDPQTVYFTSGALDWPASNSATLVFADDSPSFTSDVTVIRVSAAASSSQISDERYPSQVRVLHAAFGVDNVDMAENANFSPPLVDNLAFGEITADLPITEGTNTYTFTDTGNQGAPIAESEFLIGNGRYQTFVLVGPLGDEDILPLLGERRPLVTSGRLSFVHVASAFDFVDLYLLDAGESVEDNDPNFAFLPFKTPAPMNAIEAKSYELTATIAGEKTVLAGPLSIDLAVGDVAQIFVLETMDPNAATFEVVWYAQ